MKTLLAALVVSLQVAWVLGTAFWQEYQLAAAPVVHLETRPVDPRDLLRGDYVILSYDISEVPLALFQPRAADDPTPGGTAFVVLEKQGEFHRAVRASLDKPEAQPGQTIIRGRVEHTWPQWDAQGKRVTNTVVRLRYGLERYYVREGTGNPRGKLTAEVAVSRDGRPMLKQLYLDGRPYREAMKP
jgi:uncharacterized membrane-anchored protein